MKISRKDRATLARVLSAETTDFRTLVTLIGLNMQTALRGADLRGLDFGTTDLSGLDLTMADVSGSDLSCTIGLDPATQLVTDVMTRLPASVARLPFEPEMVLIPNGSFHMGATRSENNKYGWNETNNRPKHTVAIDYQFSIGRFPVTRREYAAFVEDIGGEIDMTWVDVPFPQSNDHPVVHVSALDALAYTHWLSRRTGRLYRLPTEAEWEYAARARTTTTRYWGNGWRHARYFCHATGWGTAAVGSYKPNIFGVYDMLGNVWEWTADAWNDDYIGSPTDGSAWTTGQDDRRPRRGGSWDDHARGLRSAYRVNTAAVERRSDTGFRVVCNAF